MHIKYTVTLLNNDARKISHLVSSRAQLFQLRFQIILYLVNPQILLFRMVCLRPFFFDVFMEKSAVYEQGLSPSLLGITSLITTPSNFFSLITTFQRKSSQKAVVFEKNLFSRFLFGKRGKVSLAVLKSMSSSIDI